jgi:hypothetical protein
MVLIDFPLIVASFWSISAFYLYAQKVLYPKSWWKDDCVSADADGGGRGAYREQQQGRD